MLFAKRTRLVRFLLFGLYRVEHGFLNICFHVATGGINKRIRAARLEFRVLLVHVVFGGVIAERYLAGQ